MGRFVWAVAALSFSFYSSPVLSAGDPTTVLFERTDTRTKVASSAHQGVPYCLLTAQTQDQKAGVAMVMNGGTVVDVGMFDRREGSPIRAARKGATLPLAVEVEGTRQVYQAKKSDNDFVEASPGRASQNHLRKAMQSNAGMRLILSNSEPVSITVEDEAEQAFDNCVMSLLRQRMEGLSKRLEGLAR